MSVKEMNCFGLLHKALGKAKLADFDSKSLIVSNIGRTGSDGIAIELEKIEFWEGSFSFAPMDKPTADSSVTLSVTGDTSNTRQVRLFAVRYYLGGNSLVASVDNSGLKPEKQSIKMIRNKKVIKEIDLEDFRFAIDLPPVEVVKSTFQGGCKFEFWKRNNKVEQSFRFQQTLPISVAGSETLEMDRIDILPQYASFDTEKFLVLEALARNIRAILIFDEITKMPKDWNV